MARMYTLDKKLLCGSPEIRIGEKVYPVDDRTATVRKALEIFQKSENNLDNTEEVMRLAFGENYSEIEKMNMSFSAYQELLTLVISAMTGSEPEELRKKEDSFQ